MSRLLLLLVCTSAHAKRPGPGSPAQTLSIVDQLKTVVMGYEAAFDELVPCGNELQARALARDLAGRPYEWTDLPWSDCVERLGWEPDGASVAVPWIQLGPKPGQFRVGAVVDADGDGVLLLSDATRERNATLHTDPSVK